MALNQAIVPYVMADSKEPMGGAEAHSKSSKQGRPLSGTRSQVLALGGMGWGTQFLAQSFLRGHGTPVSTWQIPVRGLLKVQRKNRQKEE